MIQTPIDSARTLRMVAEEKARLKEEGIVEVSSPEETRHLLHELRVHQIELEMQNDELQRSHLELEASRERYFELYDLAPVGYLTLNSAGLIQEGNFTAATMFGVAREALFQVPLSRFIFSEDQDTYYLNRKHIVEKGDFQEWEMRLIRADGSPFWAHLQATSDKASDLRITVSDITMRKQERVLQARLRISDYALGHSLNELLTKVLDEAEALSDSQIGFFHFVEADQVTLLMQTWSTNTLTTICTAEVNQAHYPLASAGVWADCIREKQPLIHNNYASLPNRSGLPPGHAPVMRELVVPVFRNNLIVAVLGVGNKKTEYTIQEKDTLQHLANLAWDIVTRKRTEEALRASGEKFKAYVDNSFDVIFALNAQGTFQFVSRAWERHFGYPIGDVIGKQFSLFVHPDDIAPCAEYLAHILNDDQIGMTSPPYRVKRSDGSLRTFIANGTRYLDANNEWQFIGIGRDITDQKEAELKIVHAKEAAESANIAKSDFLATMSHEIRTPLSAMLGNVELLEGSPLTPQQQEYLKDCKSASQMLLQVINDVLDFSKIESGKLELINETFSISSLSQQLVRIFSASARSKGLDLILTQADTMVEYISGDQQRLRQIVANLLSNAIKFTSHGAVSLHISSEPSPVPTVHDRAVLRIVVTDTGIGIPADKLDHIFDSFTQVQSFSTRSVSGTGLGLPICRRLLTLMGGTITVSSVPGEGSVFTVVVPTVACKAQAQTQTQTQTQTQAQAQAPSRKIILADDDDRGRSVAQKLLQRKGYRVTAVANGAGILDALQKESFEILLTDISMPDMDGTQVARIIRSGERPGIDPNIPIIAMTAHAFSDDRERFLAAGINGYVAKPVNLDELFRQIEELCGGR